MLFVRFYTVPKSIHSIDSNKPIWGLRSLKKRLGSILSWRIINISRNLIGCFRGIGNWRTLNIFTANQNHGLMYHWYKCIAAVFKRIIFNILTFFFISIIVLAKVKTERIGKDSFTVKKKQQKKNKKSRQKERKCGSKICKKNLVLIFVCMIMTCLLNLC